MEEGAKPRDLEDRTFRFAESVRAFVKQLPRTISNTEDVRQVVRASGSVAANWIEADEALSKKDFLMRVKICRKESKESRLFLRLVDAGLTKSTVTTRDGLAAEARELTLNIFIDYFEKWITAPSFFNLVTGYLFGIWELGFGTSGTER
jgi:four helix bundle protein